MVALSPPPAAAEYWRFALRKSLSKARADLGLYRGDSLTASAKSQAARRALLLRVRMVGERLITLAALASSSDDARRYRGDVIAPLFRRVARFVAQHTAQLAHPVDCFAEGALELLCAVAEVAYLSYSRLQGLGLHRGLVQVQDATFWAVHTLRALMRPALVRRAGYALGFAPLLA
jgi:hypothetical protein